VNDCCCTNDNLRERRATPDEVDNGHELGIAWNPVCSMCIEGFHAACGYLEDKP